MVEDDAQTHGATFVSVVLGSDKTTVSVGTGDNEFYPLYASTGPGKVPQYALSCISRHSS
jgi:hypothetical protein